MAEVTITPKSAARAAKAIKDELAKREQQLTWEENLEKRLEEIKALLDSEDGRKGRVDAGIYFKSVAFSAQGVSLAYTDREGDKGFTCEEEPRKEFYLAFLAISIAQSLEWICLLETGKYFSTSGKLFRISTKSMGYWTALRFQVMRASRNGRRSKAFRPIG